MARPTKSKGVLITFEGGDGVGKSTQIALLERALRSKNFKVFVTQEPGGTPIGQKLRDLVKSVSMHPRTELLVFEASRAELVETELKPRLAEGELILCDRYEESSLVYQGLARGLGMPLVQKANQLATGGLKADYIIHLDHAASMLKERLHERSKEDRFDHEKQDFHRKIQLGFRTLAKKDKRFHSYYSEKAIDQIHQAILKDLMSFLQKRYARKSSTK